MRNKCRNEQIVEKYRQGIPVYLLAEEYWMTESGIRAILRLSLEDDEYFRLRGKRRSRTTCCMK